MMRTMRQVGLARAIGRRISALTTLGDRPQDTDEEKLEPCSSSSAPEVDASFQAHLRYAGKALAGSPGTATTQPARTEAAS
jgi:hypothetical protein